MKSSIKIIIIILLSISCFSFKSTKFPTESCLESLKNGKFVYSGALPGSYIERAGDKQTEYADDGKSKIISKVEWITASHYRLTILKLVNCEGSPVKKKDTIDVEILECNEAFYNCKIVFKSEAPIFAKYEVMK